MFTKISVLNKSTCINNNDLSTMIAACNLQITRDFSPSWGKIAIPLVLETTENGLAATGARIYMFDNADQAGALGYHDETMQGLVYARVFAQTIMSYGLSPLYNIANPNNITVSSVLSHEVLEMLGNPYVDLWADGPLSNGCSEYAYELCDAVESNIYIITVAVPRGRTTTNLKVAVSNFLYPQYFDTATQRGTKMDQMGLITHPYTMTSGGYMILRDPRGNEVELFGEHYPEVLKAIHL